MTRQVWIVFDLGFGDAGKGATVDFLVRDRRAELVVRYNGGAQAGHNVVTPDGRHHTFSQFGAGTFVPNTLSLLGPAFVMHPGGFLVEAAYLQRQGVDDAIERTFVDEQALVISPFQQAAGRLRELARADQQHGTCGVGVGEAVSDSLNPLNDTLRARDLLRIDSVADKLRRQHDRKRTEFGCSRASADSRSAAELEVLLDRDSIDRTIEQWRPLSTRLQVLTSQQFRHRIHQSSCVVFEGAQGVLLDQDHGFHPHTTWSDCTPRGAMQLLDGSPTVFRMGVTRCYSVRHGAGPFPSHDPRFDSTQAELHNDETGWQGAFRRGPLDLVLLKYALDVSGGVDGLAVTCLDRFPANIPLCTAHHLASERRTRLPPPGPGELAQLERLGAELSRSRIECEEFPYNEFVRKLEGELQTRVVLASFGPTAAARHWLLSPMHG